MSDPLAEFNSYGGMIEALRHRKATIGLTDKAMDQLAGWPDGFTGKVLGPAMVRVFSQTTLGLALQVLGAKLALFEDPEAMANMERRWEKEKGARKGYPDTHSISKALVERVKPALFREKAAQLTEGRKKIRPATRRRIARNAARARWARKRKNVPPVR